jgi:hypothetical protein
MQIWQKWMNWSLAFAFSTSALAFYQGQALAASTSAEEIKTRKAALTKIVNSTSFDPGDYDSTYIFQSGMSISQNLLTCRYEKDEMDFLDRLLALLKSGVQRNASAEQMYAQIKAMPEFTPAMLRANPENVKHLAELKDAADNASMAITFIPWQHCRLLIEMQALNGAGQDELLSLIKNL